MRTMLNASINTFSLYTDFSQTYRIENFMREVVMFGVQNQQT